jgi:hypothetical protein
MRYLLIALIPVFITAVTDNVTTATATAATNSGRKTTSLALLDYPGVHFPASSFGIVPRGGGIFNSAIPQNTPPEENSPLSECDMKKKLSGIWVYYFKHDGEYLIFLSDQMADSKMKELKIGGTCSLQRLKLGENLIKFTSDPNKYLMFAPGDKGNLRSIAGTVPNKIPVYIIDNLQDNGMLSYIRVCFTKQDRDNEWDKIELQNKRRCGKRQTDLHSLTKDMQDENTRISFKLTRFVKPHYQMN